MIEVPRIKGPAGGRALPPAIAEAENRVPPNESHAKPRAPRSQARIPPGAGSGVRGLIRASIGPKWRLVRPGGGIVLEWQSSIN
jgi:hypothetical protein